MPTLTASHQTGNPTHPQATTTEAHSANTAKHLARSKGHHIGRILPPLVKFPSQGSQHPDYWIQGSTNTRIELRGPESSFFGFFVFCFCFCTRCLAVAVVNGPIACLQALFCALFCVVTLSIYISFWQDASLEPHLLVSLRALPGTWVTISSRLGRSGR